MENKFIFAKVFFLIIQTEREKFHRLLKWFSGGKIKGKQMLRLRKETNVKNTRGNKC